MSALIVDIESRDWRREFNNLNKIPPEHPRASTTDDVECFFSILRDMVGKDFTHKQVLKIVVIITSIFQAMFGWRKSCEELIKRMDPDLPYYYHASTHNRFYEDELPKFDEPAHRTKKQRPPRRELLW